MAVNDIELKSFKGRVVGSSPIDMDWFALFIVKVVETESEVKGLKDMSIEAYREAAKADAWLFGDYDGYESYDINTKKVSEEDESVWENTK